MQLPPPPVATAPALLTLRDANIGFDAAKPTLSNVTLEVLPTMRLVLLGHIGAGKSTLLHALAGKIKIASGTLQRMKFLQLTHWDASKSRDMDEDEETPLGFVLRLAGGAVDEEEALAMLNGIGVDKWAARRPCGCLSAGERTRTAQCSLALAPRHLLILDEPSAFLGSAAVESLAATLAPGAWAGALVFATSSRATADALQPTHTAILAGGSLELHDGAPTADDFAALDAAPSLAAAAARDAEERAVCAAAISSIGPRSDWSGWARGDGLYLRRDALIHRLDDGSPTVVVDVRDDDAIGGRIRGAMHLADEEFNADSILAIIERVRELAAAPTTDEMADDGYVPAVSVVIHCMESARRGPRCARRVALALEALREHRRHMHEERGRREGGGSAEAANDRRLPGIEVRVLEGGFDQWCRRFWADASRVEQYDDEIWGYAEMGGTSLFAHDAPMHPGYVRPLDQEATPWSMAGASHALS